MPDCRSCVVGGSLALLALVAAAVPARPARCADAEPQEKITYADQVRPIFREHCFTCHNQNKATNDLALDSYERLMAGGAGGEVIEAGDPDSSYLWMLVSHQDQPNMPPKQDKLPEAKLAIIKRWIAGGALKDSGSKAAAKKPGLDLSAGGGGQRPKGEPVMPEGLLRQPAVYTPRAGAATAIAASPWASLAAVAGQRQIVLYNSDTAELLGVLPFPEGIPQVLRFSRSGSLLVAGGGHDAARGLVAVYDVKTGRRLFDVGDELDTVLAADINDTHTKIALGGPQRVVRVYSTADGSPACEMRKHTDWIYALEFSPDGVLLATADRGGGLLVWEADTGREYLNLEGHKGAVTAVSWRADSNVLASASEDGTVKLWDMQSGKQVKSIGAHGGGVTALEFTHDGRFVTAGRDKLVKAWSPAGSQLRAFPAFPEPALEATFTHDGARVVAGDWSGETRMWNTEDGKEVARLPANPPTLEMVLAAARQKAAEAQQAADQAAAELAQADKALAEAKAAARQAADQAAEAARVASTRLDAAKKAAAEAVANKETMQKAATEAEAAAKQAAEQAASAKQAAEKLSAQVPEAQKQRDAKAPPAEAAAKAAAEARAAVDRAAAEKAAFEGSQSQKPPG